MNSKVIITMQPDSCCSLFWWEDGTCCGDSDSLSLYEDGDSIEIKIPGLENWLNYSTKYFILERSSLIYFTP